MRHAFRARLIIACVSGLWLAHESAAAIDLLLIANSNDELKREGEGYVSVFDPESGKLLGTIADGGITAHELVVSPDGRLLYLPIYSNANLGQPGSDGRSVSVVDLRTRKQVGRVEFDHGVRPHYGRFGPDGLLYVTTELDQTVSIIDPKTRAVVGTVPTGQASSHNVAVSRDGHWAYTSNVLPGTVSVLDLKTRRLAQVIPIAPPVAGEGPLDARGWRVQRVSVSRDDRTVYTCDWVHSTLVAIDAASRTVRGTLPLPSPCYNVESTLDGRLLLAISQSANKLVVIDAASLAVVRQIDVPANPQQVFVRPDGKIAYISCDKEKKVVAIDMSEWKIVKSFDTGYWPDGIAWASLR